MSESVVSAFNAIATGSFFYIGTTEILAEEFHTHAHKRLERWLKFAALFVGCALMAVVRIWTGDEDHAGHSHDH
jgi:zinc transporter ZupT